MLLIEQLSIDIMLWIVKKNGSKYYPTLWGGADIILEALTCEKARFLVFVFIFQYD
jgi:hypothetical protein